MTTRREFLGRIGAVPLVATARPSALSGFDALRGEFPALSQTVNGHPLGYLDSAATTHRPRAVIEAVADFYRQDNANPGRALHSLARRSYARYEAARETVARFVNASDPNEIVWTRGTTEAINLVASSWGSANLGPGDEVVLTVAEHYSNLIPWQFAARRSGAKLQFVDIDDQGRLRLDQLDALLSARTKLVCFSHVSNVLGLINPAKEICARAHRAGARVLIDGAQAVPHFPVDVQALGCDFLAFSGHKMLGPMGIGVLWARREILEEMPPYQGGSNMAHDVDLESAHYAEGALKFGAGTPNVSGPVGLAAANLFLESAGREALWASEQALTRHALKRLAEIEGLRLLGPKTASDKISVFTFVIEGRPPLDVVAALDARGIAVRGGDLASLPLLKRLGISAALRASFFLYSTMEEVDRLVSELKSFA